MSKMGRPLTEIKWPEFEKLCGFQCTLEEIASFFDCSADTIERHVKKKYDLTFAEIRKQKAEVGKVSIRRKMHELALSGDRVMLIWLSKQHLGMRDKHEEPISEQILSFAMKAYELSQMPKEQVAHIAQDLLKKVIPIHGKA
jgi:hypothetical protein